MTIACDTTWRSLERAWPASRRAFCCGRRDWPTCVSTYEPTPITRFGESLDWSSPGLLARLGLAADALVAAGTATYKRKIVVFEGDAAPWTAMPPPAIRRTPLRFETVTLHVDRTALDARLCERAAVQGTQFVWERVAHVEHDGDRVVACTSSGGTRVQARWLLDASGTARVFSRAMNIPVTSYGRAKVCLWTYFDTTPLEDGTVFFVDNRNEYLRWVWDIPISPTQTSVGFVLPAWSATAGAPATLSTPCFAAN